MTLEHCETYLEDVRSLCGVPDAHVSLLITRCAVVARGREFGDCRQRRVLRVDLNVRVVLKR